jgi:hypothetical protein
MVIDPPMSAPELTETSAQWRNRAHFFGVAAGMMRRILVDHARGRLADKRGGGWERVTLVGDEVAAAGSGGVDVLALREALERLAAFDPRQERIVELRYFGGLTIEEAAEVIGISPATVVREWTIAKAWLRADLIHPHERSVAPFGTPRDIRQIAALGQREVRGPGVPAHHHTVHDLERRACNLPPSDIERHRVELSCAGVDEVPGRGIDAGRGSGDQRLPFSGVQVP